MDYIPAKTILSKVKYGSEWYGIDYNMNLYRGCCHGCIYCDSRSSCYQIDNFDHVRAKEHALVLLEKELRRKNDHGVVGIGAMSDTYNPFEQSEELTRNALKLLKQYNFGVSIDTKSDLILRDLDLLKEINEQNNVIVKMTITTADDALCHIIEPHVTVSSRRFEAIRQLNEAGIFAGIMLNPILPYITDSEENIIAMVEQASVAKAKFIHTYGGMTCREKQREYYYQKLDEHFPGLKEKYQRVYGNSYLCKAPNAKRLYRIFKEECQKYHILYRMSDIIKAYKKEIKTQEQLTLF